MELVSAFVFGLLLEQGDIFLFGTYRYNENWVLLGDVPVAIALTWALIIAGGSEYDGRARDCGRWKRGNGSESGKWESRAQLVNRLTLKVKRQVQRRG